MLFKDMMKSRLVEPGQLQADLEKFYLSKYFINELREYFTLKEQEIFKNSLPTDPRPKVECKKPWPICYLKLEKVKSYHEPHTVLLSTHFILSNFNLGHFIRGVKSNRELPLPTQESAESTNHKIREEDLLIERQRHVCGCRDNEIDKLKSEVKQRITRQLSNPDFLKQDIRFSPVAKQITLEVNEAYENYMRGQRETLIGRDDKSDYSHSTNSKPSHDITNYQNTCSIS